MKPEIPDKLDDFLGAVHRRMLILRALERLGLCLLLGCAASLLLAPVLIFRGSSTGALSAALVALTTVAGIVWAATDRPRRLAAAAEADRQLRLADLLSTASVLPRETIDPFERTILALAHARCAATSPSALVLHRYGARGWGGIALALAAVCAVGLMTAQTPLNHASAAATPKSWQDLDPTPENRLTTATARTPDFRRQKPGNGDDDDPASPIEQTTPDRTTNTNPIETGNSGTGNSTESGTGAGSAQSTAKPRANDPLNPATDAPRANMTGQTPAGGGAGVANHDATTDSTTGLTATSSAARRPAPVWRADTWPTDRDRARSAVRDGKVPDRYRDLVRDYFERD